MRSLLIYLLLTHYADINPDVQGIPISYPTEAEWENAAREGRSEEEIANQAEEGRHLVGPCQVNARGTAQGRECEDGEDTSQYDMPVKSFIKPNILGLYDMFGNMWEWCRSSEGTESAYVLKGGGFTTPANELSPSLRRTRSLRGATGFRCLIEQDPSVGTQ